MRIFTCVTAISSISWVCSLNVFESPMQNPYLIEGDIVSHDRTRTTIADESKKWPNATVPYVISKAPPRIRKLLRTSIEQYHNATCVRFVPRRKQPDFVEIIRGTGCSSYVGRVGGKQQLSLGKGCGYLGTVLHELGHAVGLYHEHNRSDRDDFVTINIENVPKEFHHAFEKLAPEDNRLYTGFDTESIMLYGSRAFTTNYNNLTIVKKDGSLLREVHEKTNLSTDDIKRLNLLYNCTGQA